MHILVQILVGLVALIHLYIAFLETVLWSGPRGQQAFGMTAAFAQATRVLAANQGLYNGFLAAGLIWSLVQPDAGFAWQLQLFFLGCVAIAGMVGAATAGRRILLVQTVPAALAMIAVILA